MPDMPEINTKMNVEVGVDVKQTFVGNELYGYLNPMQIVRVGVRLHEPRKSLGSDCGVVEIHMTDGETYPVGYGATRESAWRDARETLGRLGITTKELDGDESE